jgi:high affinity choline transporter 7
VWNETSYEGPIPIPEENKSLVLPLVLQHLTPIAVQFVGLGAVSAAVMSSSDSSLLSAASMFSRNVYKPLLRPNASEPEVLWAMRVAILVVGATAATLGVCVQSVYGLWYLSSDLVYVLLFPQLLCVVHLRSRCNTYGSAAAYGVGLTLRVIGGESLLGLPALVHYPFYDETLGQLFPFRTFAMLSSMITLLTVSHIAQRLFASGHLKAKHDLFHCFNSVMIWLLVNKLSNQFHSFNSIYFYFKIN